MLWKKILNVGKEKMIAEVPHEVEMCFFILKVLLRNYNLKDLRLENGWMSPSLFLS